MKTAISIPDKVFESAEQLARRFGQSRSQLYTNALSSYVGKYYSDTVTSELNKVYQEHDSSLDPAVQAVQAQSLPKEEW